MPDWSHAWQSDLAHFNLINHISVLKRVRNYVYRVGLIIRSSILHDQILWDLWSLSITSLNNFTLKFSNRPTYNNLFMVRAKDIIVGQYDVWISFRIFSSELLPNDSFKNNSRNHFICLILIDNLLFKDWHILNNRYMRNIIILKKIYWSI